MLRQPGQAFNRSARSADIPLLANEWTLQVFAQDCTPRVRCRKPTRDFRRWVRCCFDAEPCIEGPPASADLGQIGFSGPPSQAVVANVRGITSLPRVDPWAANRVKARAARQFSKRIA